jgi:hypothetical protein
VAWRDSRREGVARLWREELWPVGSPKLVSMPAVVQVRSRVGLEPRSSPAGESCLSFAGAITLGCPHALLFFRSGDLDEPNFRQAPSELECALLPHVPRIPLLERLLERPSGRPRLGWIGFQTVNHRPLSNRICIGRSAARAAVAEPEFEIPARVRLWMSLRGITRAGRPTLQLSGALQLDEGICVSVMLAERCDRFGGPAGRSEGALFPMMAPGTTLAIPRLSIMPRDAEKLWISLALRRAWGGALGEETTAGRCVMPN